MSKEIEMSRGGWNKKKVEVKDSEDLHEKNKAFLVYNSQKVGRLIQLAAS